MLLVTTPTGNSGHHVLRAAIERGAAVRVVVRNPKKLARDLNGRCEVVVGDMREPAVLAKAAAGVNAAFFCVPQSAKSDNVAAYYQSFVEPAVQAFRSSGVQRVVTISGGRGVTSDIGPSGPLAAMEKSFEAVGMFARHVRCGYFMENFRYMVPQLKFKSSFALPLGASDTLALESAQDIGSTAARWLLDASWRGAEAVSVDGGDVASGAAIASTFSAVLGKRITFHSFTSDEYRAMLTKYGVSPAMAQCLKEMFDAFEHESVNGKNRIKTGSGVSLASWTKLHLVPAMRISAVIRQIIAG